MQAHMGVMLRSGVNDQGPWEAGFVVVSSWGTPLSLREGVIVSVE